MILEQELRYGGTLVNYYVVCKRKLWLFAHQITFEKESDTVQLGRFIAQASYSREDKEIRVDETISMDWIDFENKVIHEVKKSDRFAPAHIWQVKYYIYFLETKGATGFRAQIDYPKLKKKEAVELTDADREKFKRMLHEIDKIISSPIPPVKEKTHLCRSCSYFEFCWV